MRQVPNVQRSSKATFAELTSRTHTVSCPTESPSFPGSPTLRAKIAYRKYVVCVDRFRRGTHEDSLSLFEVEASWIRLKFCSASPNLTEKTEMFQAIRQHRLKSLGCGFWIFWLLYYGVLPGFTLTVLPLEEPPHRHPPNG